MIGVKKGRTPPLESGPQSFTTPIMAGDVLGWVQSGKLKLRLEHLFNLSDAAEAHRQLEGRATTGKVVLVN